MGKGLIGVGGDLPQDVTGSPVTEESRRNSKAVLFFILVSLKKSLPYIITHFPDIVKRIIQRVRKINFVDYKY